MKQGGSDETVNLEEAFFADEHTRLLEELRKKAERQEKREAAYALLDHATGQHLPFDAGAPPARRFAQMERWESWYGLVAGELVYDASKGRLVAKSR